MPKERGETSKGGIRKSLFLSEANLEHIVMYLCWYHGNSKDTQRAAPNAAFILFDEMYLS